MTKMQHIRATNNNDVVFVRLLSSCFVNISVGFHYLKIK